MAYTDVKPTRVNPAGLGAAIMVNAAVLAALLTATPVVKKVAPSIIEIFTPVEPKPPEPLPELPKPQPDTASETALRVEPVIDVPTPTNLPIITLGDAPVIDLDPVPGNGDAGLENGPVTPVAPVLTDATIDPRYMRDFQPAYPPSKIRLEETGRVTVRVLVGTNGRVLQVQPVGSPDAQFLEATRKQALSKWRFKPATRDGVPIEVWRQISVRFELNG